MKINMRCWTRDENGIKYCSIDEVISFIDSNIYIECDTETSGLEPHINDILCIQFGNTNSQYLVEWGTELIPLLSKYFRDSSKTFIFQNAKFDLQFLYKHNIIVHNVWDTFLAECVLTCGTNSRRSLDVLAQKYLGINLSKTIRDSIPKVGLTDEVVMYGLDDVKYLSLIRDKQLEELKKYDLLDTIDLDNKFVKVLAYIEYCGIGFNKDKWMSNYRDNLKVEQGLLEKMNKFVVENKLKGYYNYADLFSTNSITMDGIEYTSTIVWTSPLQVAKLFKDIGIEVEFEEDGEIKYSVGKQVLQQNTDNELVKLYSQYIKNRKLLSSFGEDYLKFINPVTNKVHSSYKQILNTGRMSSGDKANNKPNLQQLPADPRYRECFIPAEGNTLIAADYNGMESVVFANMTMDSNLLDFYDNSPNADMHSFIAKKCFPKELENIPIEEVKKKRPDLRQNAKAAGFAIQFGGNGITISNNLGISLKEGEETYQSYMSAFTGVKDHFKKVFSTTLNDGYITFNNVSKRKSFFDFMEEYKELEEKVKKIDWESYRNEKAARTVYFTTVLGPTVREYFKLRGIIERRSYNYP